MKPLVVVAHPDDCILFALGIIHQMPSWPWEIAYLTYDTNTKRGKEISDFWQKRNIPTHWMGYVDDWRDIEKGSPSFNTDEARDRIKALINNYNLIVTHDANGDYGHLHHQFVHQSVVAHHDTVITFSPFGQGNLYIELPDHLYSLSEIPEHATLGDFISPIGRRNEYLVPDHIKSLFNIT